MRTRIAIVSLFALSICFTFYILANAQDYVDLVPRKGQYFFKGGPHIDFLYDSEFRLSPIGDTTVMQITPSRNVIFYSTPKLTVAGIIAGTSMFRACASGSFSLTSPGAYNAASVSTTGRDTTQKIYVHGVTGGKFAFATADATRSLRVYLYSASLAADLDNRDYDSLDYDSGGASNVGMYHSDVIAHATGYASDTYILGLYLYGSTYNGFNFVQGNAKICANELP